MNSDQFVIATVYNEYFNEKRQELRAIKARYSKSVNMPERRTLRKRIEQLVAILNNHRTYIKINLCNYVDIPYTELDQYPDLIEVGTRIQELRFLST